MAAPAAPAAGAGIEAIAGLLLIVAFVVLLGLQQAWRASIGWMFHKLADLIDVPIGLPHLGSVHPFGPVAHALRAASDNVYAGLGAAALNVENSALWLFHQAGRQIRWTGREISALAHDTLHGLQGLVTAEIPHAIRVATNPLGRRLRAAERAAARAAAHAFATARHLEAVIEGIPGQIERRIPQALKGIRSTLERLLRDGRGLRARLHAIEKLLGAAAFAAATAVALNRLGLRWLRCPSLGRLGRKIGCGGFAFAEELFALSFAPFVLQDACRIMRQVERFAVAIQPALVELVLGVEGWICGGPSSLPSGIEARDLKRVSELPSGL